MKKMLILLAILVLMSGCSSSMRRGIWVKDGGSYEQFSKDYADCKRDTYAFINVAPKIQDDLLQCMNSKGYFWKIHSGGDWITGSTLFSNEN